MLRDLTKDELLTRLLAVIAGEAPSSALDIKPDQIDQDRDDRSHTIPEFCRLESISGSTYYKLKKLGLGPDEMNFPGLRMVRISPGARERWHERMQDLSAQRAVRLEQQRRAAMASAAGKLGGSPKHSKRRKRK